jgi:hypothetical protein
MAGLYACIPREMAFYSNWRVARLSFLALRPGASYKIPQDFEGG